MRTNPWPHDTRHGEADSLVARSTARSFSAVLPNALRQTGPTQSRDNRVSARVGRTPSAVAMKACNFASRNPAQRARSIKALGNVSRTDRALWNAFQANPEAVAADAEAAQARLTGGEVPLSEAELDLPEGPTEISRTVRARRVQAFFRVTVLVSYQNRCALSGIALPELLNASHIIPWAADARREPIHATASPSTRYTIVCSIASA